MGKAEHCFYKLARSGGKISERRLADKTILLYQRLFKLTQDLGDIMDIYQAGLFLIAELVILNPSKR